MIRRDARDRASRHDGVSRSFGIQYDRETQSIAVFALFLVGEADPTSSGHALGMGIGLLLRSQRCIDLASNSASGQCGQSRLGSAGLDAVVEFIPPLPDVGFGGRNDRVWNTPVNHQQALPGRNQRASACSINPGDYGSRSTPRESRKNAALLLRNSVSRFVPDKASAHWRRKTTTARCAARCPAHGS